MVPQLPQRPSTAALSSASQRVLQSRQVALPHEMFISLIALADAQLAHANYNNAEASLEEALRWSQVMGGHDAEVDTLCRLAETAACSAEADERKARGSGSAARRRARAHAQQISAQAAHVADPAWEIKVLLRASDVLDRCGNRLEAVELQIRAVELMAAEMAALR